MYLKEVDKVSECYNCLKMMIKDHLHVILFVLFFIEPESRKEVYLSMKLLQSNKIFNQKIAMKCLVIE